MSSRDIPKLESNETDAETDPADVFFEDGDEAELDHDSDTVKLRSGECLDLDRCSAVLKANKSRIIAIIAPSDSGKTTLIAALHELGQRISQGEFEFARSYTLIAFERACHESRIASGRAKPVMLHTPHSTSPGGVLFYHMGLYYKRTNEIIDLLLADRTGEEYNGAKDDPTAAEFIEVRRADSVTVLVDGKKMLDIAERHDAISDTILTIKALIDANHFTPDQRLIVILTKQDLIADSSESEKQMVSQDYANLMDKIRRQFAKFFSEVVSLEIAAAPKLGSDLPLGYGVEGLLKQWVIEKKHTPVAPSECQPKRSIARFDFARDE